MNPQNPGTPGTLRDAVWASLMRHHAAAYPLPVHGHHPNFRGASEAAALLMQHLLNTARLRPGDTVLSYPDYVLKPLRQLALKSGVNVVVPDKYQRGWWLLEAVQVKASVAASIAGAERWGQALASLPGCSLAFVACVAVDAEGQVLSKGYGFSLPDLSLESVTIVHPLQLLPELPGEYRVSHYATPDRVRYYTTLKPVSQKR